MFKLGDSVRVNGFVEKAHAYDGGLIKTVYDRHNEMAYGIVCGKRNCFEGFVPLRKSNTWLTEDDLCSFTRTKTVPVYLVAVDMGRMLKVLAEDLEVIPEDLSKDKLKRWLPIPCEIDFLHIVLVDFGLDKNFMVSRDLIYWTKTKQNAHALLKHLESEYSVVVSKNQKKVVNHVLQWARTHAPNTIVHSSLWATWKKMLIT